MCKWVKNKTMESMNDSEIMSGYIFNKLKRNGHISQITSIYQLDIQH